MLETIRRHALVVFLLVMAMASLSDLLGLRADFLARAKQLWGSTADDRLVAWQNLTQSLQGKPEIEQVRLVNAFMDKIPYISDQDHWHQEDYWATPFEFLGSNGGDCEDFALAKYFTLRTLGIPDARLRMTYVEALSINQPHMVLAYYPTPGSDPLVLDSLISRILPASERTDLLPIYSFNAQGLWISGTDDTSPVNNGHGLDKWQDVLLRMRGQPGSYYQGFPATPQH